MLGDPELEALARARVLLDCRRLGAGGAERATELLLRGLREATPPGRWVLWGPPSAAAHAWDGAVHAPSRHSPKAALGQRDALALPAHDVALYMHQQRPLRPGRSVTLVHDTIPLRYGSGRAARRLKAVFLRAVVALSTHVLTVSQHSRASILRDLGATPDKVTVVAYPVDVESADRVWELRRRLPREEVALYVGRFAPHKNLERLVDAFARTEFRARGGRLLLVGGEPAEAAALGGSGVELEGVCTQERLEHLYASSRLLVLPSLEEGFGLPAWEALSVGLPACVSDAGSLPEVTRGFADTFPPTSVAAMAESIDRVASSASSEREEATRAAFLAATPSLADFTAGVVGAVARTLVRSR